MQRLEVSCAVRHIYIYMSLGARGLTLVQRGADVPPQAFDNEGEGSVCVLLITEMRCHKRTLWIRCVFLWSHIFVRSHTVNPVSLVAWWHQPVCEGRIVLQIQWQVWWSLLLFVIVFSLKCSILHISSFFPYTQFANYCNLLCWRQLNKPFDLFPQRLWRRSCEIVCW